MMNLTRKAWIALAILLLFVAMTPTALAAAEDDAAEEESSSFWEDVKSAGSGLWQSTKEHAPGWWESIKGAASSAKDAVQEHGPEWVETAKDKGSELLDKGAGALQNAGEQVSGFLEDQQNQFWERTEQQIYGTTPTPESSVPAESSDVAPSGAVPSDTAPSGTAPEEAVGSTPVETGGADADKVGATQNSDNAGATGSADGAGASDGQLPQGTEADGGGWTITIDQTTENHDVEEVTEQDEPQSWWARFWDLSKRDAALRWEMMAEFWPLMILAALAGVLIGWLIHRKR